jgi:hypothetical protein
MSKEKEGRIDLRHEPEPGYSTIFYIVFSIAVLYLVIIMAATL